MVDNFLRSDLLPEFFSFLFFLQELYARIRYGV